MKKIVLFTVVSLFVLLLSSCEPDTPPPHVPLKFSSDHNHFFYDTLDATFYTLDKKSATTITFSAQNVATPSLLIDINGTLFPMAVSGSSASITIPLDTVFIPKDTTHTIVSYATYDNTTLDSLTLYSVPSDTATIVDPYVPYAWQYGYGDSAAMELWDVDIFSSINLFGAWFVTKGNKLKVAIIDEDFDVTHKDLKGSIIDTYNVVTGGTDVSGSGGHGTTVAGHFGAPLNGVGTSGAAPDVQFILIKYGYNDAQDIAAFEYAKNAGAKIINCSWGDYHVSDAMVAELKSLYDAGITVVFASGNDGRSLDDDGINDQSEVTWVLGVGASTAQNDVWSSSNYGDSLEVIAPGAHVLGLKATGTGNFTPPGGAVDKNYGFGSGTSYSAPIVSGVAALIQAANPSFTPAQIRERIISTAQKVGKENGANYDSKGFDTKRAYGKIDAGAAVQ